MSWTRTSLRGVAEVALGRQRAPQHAQGPHMIPYLRAANVKDGELALDDVLSMNFTPQEQKIFSLASGDVLVTEGSGSLSSVGAAAVWNGEIGGTICFQNTLLRLRPRPGLTDGKFLGWWARSAFGSGLFASVATGANIYHVSADRVRALPIEVPPLEEQRRIADFLDAESTRLGRVISARRRQVQLLEERSSARVLNAVRGVGEYGERVDSDISWLGDVPKSWPLLSVTSQFDVLLGKMLNPDRVSGEHLRPYLRNTNVQWDRIDVEDLLLMNFPPRERSRYEVLPGDLLICEGEQPGRAAIWTGPISEVYYQKALHRARSRGRSLVRWLFYCLKAATDLNVFAVEGNAATISHLTGEQLRAYRFPFPDRAIQDRIVSDLDAAALHDLHLNMRLEQQHQLMVERRQALITAAVTGRIDVTTARGIVG